MRKILLVGREGNGKASTARSLHMVSSEIQVTPCVGVGDIQEDRTESIQTVISLVQDTLQSNHEGMSAIILVLKYGVRFTKQEKDAVEITKLMFGESVFRSHGIIVMTYGDQFEADYFEDYCRQQTGDIRNLFEFKAHCFEDWCRQQTGDIHNLFEDVNYRIVLIDNRSQEQQKQLEQYTEVLRHVESIRRPYTLCDFQDALPGRRELIAREQTRVTLPCCDNPTSRSAVGISDRGNIAFIAGTVWTFFGLLLFEYSLFLGLFWLTGLTFWVLFVFREMRNGSMVISVKYVPIAAGALFIYFLVPISNNVILDRSFEDK
ncbi:protein AIG1 [Biomphalaria pfeifferi]|uniref:Protein AIG1 n=1 Tax=Biomphalaria pfeifferi TaxID=112525 RepID=A0AAD8B8R0_BIOPF|nr:protein AIG1 [Biomphalaria pfeifferi]